MVLVSVVVIAYNDASRLPTAVRSVQRQTLRDVEIIVVDDASTDATSDVVATLAADDPRITVVRREVNSGGCSAPRNDGLAIATGRYVMFCDSDDELAKHACQRLSAAADRAVADLACGPFVRHHHEPTRFIGAHDELYRRATVLNGILDRPDQLADTPAWNKLYRREFLEAAGLRFPEGLLYEDLLFVTQAYCLAERIAIVTDLIYIWNVRRAESVPSITNRGELANWQDRFEIHRRIDTFLAEQPAAAALKEAKDAKFLTADLTVFLRDLRECPAADRDGLLALARDYCSTVSLLPTPATRKVPAANRIGAFMATRDDLAGALGAADLAATGGVGARLATTGTTVRWTTSYAGDPVGDRVLAVTGQGWRTVAWDRRPYLAVVSSATIDDGRLRLAGRVHDVLDGLAGVEATGTVRVTTRAGDLVWSGPALLTPATDGLSLAASIDLAAVGRRLLRPTVGYELRIDLELRRGREHARRPLTARDAELPSTPVPLPTPWRWAVGDQIRVVEVNGRLVLAFSELPPGTQAALGAASKARYLVGHLRWPDPVAERAGLLQHLS